MEIFIIVLMGLCVLGVILGIGGIIFGKIILIRLSWMEYKDSKLSWRDFKKSSKKNKKVDKK